MVWGGRGQGRGGGEGDERDVVGGCVRCGCWPDVTINLYWWCGSTPPTGVVCRSSVHAWSGLLNQREY